MRSPSVKVLSLSISPSRALMLGLRHFLIFISMMLLGLGCGAQPAIKAKSEAERIYKEGLSALNDEDYLTATERFRAVKTKFLFSPYAAFSELRLGDTAFAQTRYYEAIETFRVFIQSRPNHAEVPYAYWKISAAYAAQRPSDFFLLPPTHERDRGSTKDALRALQNYLDRFPEHDKAAEAKALIKACRRDLGNYELYVARFYRQNKQWGAARGRYEVLIERFKDQEALWREGAEELIEIYERLELKEKLAALKLALKSSEESTEK